MMNASNISARVVKWPIFGIVIYNTHKKHI